MATPQPLPTHSPSVRTEATRGSSCRVRPLLVLLLRPALARPRRRTLSFSRRVDHACSLRGSWEVPLTSGHGPES